VRLAGSGQVAIHRHFEKLATKCRNKGGCHEDTTGTSKEEGRETESVVSGQNGDPFANRGDLRGDDGQVTFAFLQSDDGGNAGKLLQDRDVERESGSGGVVVGDDRNGSGIRNAGEVLADAVGAGFDIVAGQ
jgi:hypothetical protein